ncbi:pantothenate kinase [Nitzschia inconspicua]|uniref:pantothenate kinase n=1 Tax=Nitzschia inconspicua TaxID=303405 RepID=A0A9K3LP73_9STRA|nr:pantothenate kinase [Nitzschia inconspicua]
MLRNWCCETIPFLAKYCCCCCDDEIWKQINAFLAGAVSVCLFLFCNRFWQAVQLIPDHLHNSTTFGTTTTTNADNDEDDDESWIDPWNVPMQATNRFMASLNIGELPIPFKRRQHWPWETIRRRFVSPSLEEDHNNNKEEEKEKSTNGEEQEENRKGNNGNNTTPTDRVEVTVINEPSLHTAFEMDELSIESLPAGDDITTTNNNRSNTESYNVNSSSDTIHNNNNMSPRKKKNNALCIGSIFGLDVGGTLAKLVYFEQKHPDLDPRQTSLRERHYAKAASAQAVVMARLEKETLLSNKVIHQHHPTTTTINNTTNNNGSNDELSQHDLTAVKQSQYMLRRRSFSIGLIGRVPTKEEETEEDNDDEEEEEKRLDQETSNSHTNKSNNKNKNNTNKKKDHRSEQDLKRLYALRQESLPDDVRHFRHSVDFHTLEEDTYREIFESIRSATLDNGNYNSVDANETRTAPDSVMGRSKSMFDMSNLVQQKVEALDRFYTFARRLGDQDDAIRDHKLSFYCRELGGEFHFISFETRRMKNAMDLIRYNNLHLNIQEMGATGGGAHKFADIWERELGIRMDKQDELDSLVAGMQFVLSTVIGECYTFRPKCNAPERQVSSSTAGTSSSTNEKGDVDQSNTGLSRNQSMDSTQEEKEPTVNNGAATSAETKTNVDEWWWSRKVQRDSISYSSSYPYLLVTIGTGVSVLRVDGPRNYERISGSTIGGGTYWGLMRLLTDVESFDDAMKLAEIGDPSKVDMMVGDIYGTNSDALEKLGLPANVVASSFGKLVAKEEPAEGLTQEDLARALLLLVTNNIGQVAYLNAKLSNTRRIYFVGSFLRHNTISQRRLSYAIDFWSKGEMEALFLQHEGYFGALGAFLKSQKIEKQEEGYFQWEDGPHMPPWRPNQS